MKCNTPADGDTDALAVVTVDGAGFQMVDNLPADGGVVLLRMCRRVKQNGKLISLQFVRTQVTLCTDFVEKRGNKNQHVVSGSGTVKVVEVGKIVNIEVKEDRGLHDNQIFL